MGQGAYQKKKNGSDHVQTSGRVSILVGIVLLLQRDFNRVSHAN
jgi:hypothetical protein